MIHLLLLVLFIIDLLRACMANVLYVYVIYALILILMLLTCSMFAQVNVRSFCGDQYPIDTFCAAYG